MKKRTLEPLSRRESLALLGTTALPTLPIATPLEAAVTSVSGDANEALHFLSLETLASRIASGALSPVDVTRYMLDRIARFDRHLKSHATVTAEQALTEARFAVDEIRSGKYRGPLHGDCSLRELYGHASSVFSGPCYRQSERQGCRSQ